MQIKNNYNNRIEQRKMDRKNLRRTKHSFIISALIFARGKLEKGFHFSINIHFNSK